MSPHIVKNVSIQLSILPTSKYSPYADISAVRWVGYIESIAYSAQFCCNWDWVWQNKSIDMIDLSFILSMGRCQAIQLGDRYQDQDDGIKTRS